MKNKLAITLLITFLSFGSVFAQYENNWAVGLKIGEPVGLNIRKYFSYGDRAFDINVGTYGLVFWRERKYGGDVIYDKGSVGVMFQGIYQFHRTFGKNDKLHTYYGFGGQINSRNRPESFGGRGDSFRVISVGPAVNAGVEIAIPENDMAVFLDAGGYLEIAPKPFFLSPTYNVGLRINIIK